MRPSLRTLGAPPANVAPVTAFETGTNAWRRLTAWPAGCATGCTITPTPLYLAAGGGLRDAGPRPSDARTTEWISDPAKPTPFRARPIDGSSWSRWLVDDQREASGRTDVVVFTSDVLTAPVQISGQPIANLIASTTGTDADWVVKLIDVYPGTAPDNTPNPRGIRMGDFQMLLAGEVFRGRYRNSFSTPEALVPNQPVKYEFDLRDRFHRFLKGHRIMVQVQSTWFPVIDRNPQTFVDIYKAKPTDFQKATHRVYRTAAQASGVRVGVLK